MTSTTVYDTPITLTVDGTPVATNAGALHAGTSAALDGLTIKWGRASRLDQPAPATLSASIAVPETDASRVLDLLTPGKRILATVTTPWTNKPLPYSYNTRPLWIPNNPGEHVNLAPGPIQPNLTNPAAWENVPRYDPARPITLTAAIAAQPLPALTLAITPIYYTAPWETSATLDTSRTITITNPPAGTLTISTALGSAHTISLDPRRAGTWVGFRLTVTLNGARFSDLTQPFKANTRRWQDYNGLILTRAVITTTTNPTRTNTLFSGRVAAAPITWDETLQTARINLECNDWTVDLENRKVGAKPFEAEPTSTRLARVLAIADPNLKAEPLTATTAARRLAYRDVDAQKPMDLLREIATSNDAILWPLAHSTRGEYFKLEDQDSRKSLYRLAWDYQTGIAKAETRIDKGLPISASSITRNGFTIDRDLSDLATIARVTYKTTDDEGKQADIDETGTAPEREREYGTRELHISTWLDRKTDAAQLANSLLNRTNPGGWAITGAQINSSHPHITGDVLTQLLDASTRAGLAITLADLPAWVPGNPRVPVYLDGGTYTYTTGTWTLDLTLTRAANSGGAAAWGQIPTAKTWKHMGTLTFADIASLTAN